MGNHNTPLSRRDFLKGTAAVGLGSVMLPSLGRVGWAASKDRVTVFHVSNIDSLDPYNHSTGPIYGIWQHMLEPLAVYDFEQTRYVGALAESWEFAGKDWIFKLREGIKFHDGTPLTSEDVVFSFMQMKEGRTSLQRSPFKNIVEIKAPDKFTVVLTSEDPYVTLVDRSIRNRFITSKAAWEKAGGPPKVPVGTGPYKFKSFVRDGNLAMVRNDDYWGEKPDINEVVWRKVIEPAARISALEAGQADIINRIPSHDIARLNGLPQVDVRSVPGLRVYFLALNPAYKPWDNKLVRQAANYSVNAETILENILEGNGFVLQGPVGPHVLGYNPDLKRYPYDPKKAKELLAKAGYPNGVDVKLYYSPGRYNKDTEILQVVAQQMAPSGFRVELVPQEWVVFWGKSGVNGGKIPMYYIGRGSLLDADIFYHQYFRSGVTTRVSYENPEVDKLIDMEQTMSDHDKRVEVLQRIGALLMEDAPLIPLFSLADSYGVANNVVWTPRPDEKILAPEMQIAS